MSEALKTVREGLTAAVAAMNHMGDILNDMDAVDEEEDATHFPAFEKAPAALAALDVVEAELAKARTEEREACARELERRAELLREGTAGQSIASSRPALGAARSLERAAAAIRERGAALSQGCVNTGETQAPEGKAGKQ